MALGKWDVERFAGVTGYPAQQDDLERANCEMAGASGHESCGTCSHDKPRFMCCGSKGALRLDALKLAESVYRQNAVDAGEPSSVLDALQGAIEYRQHGRKR